MSAAEAKEYGLVDEVIKSRKELKMVDGATATPTLGERPGTGAEAVSPRKAGE
jgi:enoyl-CoA hydratase/carnithine racemase